jgi:hypothetical protein
MVAHPIVRRLAHGLVLAVLLVGRASAGELFAGLYGHGLSTPSGHEHGADFVLGYRTAPIGRLTWLAKPSVGVFVSANSSVPTDFAVVNLNWPLAISGRFYVRPAFGMAYTTGKANIGDPGDMTASAAVRARRLRLSQTRIDFGSQVLFEEEVAFGYRLNGHWAVEASYVHFSNGEILHHGANQGLDDLGLRVAYSF